jgi:hypothetical protein
MERDDELLGNVAGLLKLEWQQLPRAKSILLLGTRSSRQFQVLAHLLLSLALCLGRQCPCGASSAFHRPREAACTKPWLSRLSCSR